MCGRYTLIADLGDLAQRFEFDGSDFSYDPGYNIAPTESVLTVRNVEGREAALMKWGLIPFWAKDPKIGAQDDQRPRREPSPRNPPSATP